MKIKNILFKGTMLLFAAAILVGCETSKKGKWTDADKKSVRREIEKSLLEEGDEAAFFQDKEIREKFLDCSVSKLEQQYSSLTAANKDLEGCKKIGEECALALLGDMLKQPKRSPSMKQKRSPRSTSDRRQYSFLTFISESR
jgi:hypothetical protein